MKSWEEELAPPNIPRTVGKTVTVSAMAARRRSLRRATLMASLISLIALGTLAQVFAPLPSFSSRSTSSHPTLKKSISPRFEIDEDMFWKDGQPFGIIGGDLHYFRVHPQYWEDRLLRAKALGLNTIQTYVPWNLHEPRQGELTFEGIADIVSFLELCQKMNFLVMLRAGPYICAEWDLGGFPAWLLAIEPAIRLRSSDPFFLEQVDRWWNILLPKVSPLLYANGGPIIMVQIENEFGSYGEDKAYLHHLVNLARKHLSDDVILYTTDGGVRENLQKGTILGQEVFSAVDFTTGDDPRPIFQLQKKFNKPRKSPPLSAEFYTGWLTHWGEKIANTDATFTADSLDKILSINGSVVLYMAHGGTNFGFYSGANTGTDESDYKPDLTSYDYDAPIRESGDVDNAKYKALRRVIAKYSASPLTPVPDDKKRAAFGQIKLTKSAFLFDMVDEKALFSEVESENPIAMESLGQMFGFVLYTSEYSEKKKKSVLSIPKVHDRAQVFMSCTSESRGRPKYVGTISRWSNRPIELPYTNCGSRNKLYLLVENMGRVNYGRYLFDKKGVLSFVYLDGRPLYKWKMISIPLHNLNEGQKINSIIPHAHPNYLNASSHRKLKDGEDNLEPAFYSGHFTVNKVQDTYLSFKGWSKGVAFVNEFNIGRYWPLSGPQCDLYVPAPILRDGVNVVVILELESASPHLSLSSIDKPDFTCGLAKQNIP
ncbi:hypothetical protein M9H77_15305 [Catharanthus roseus]|uniref:Uncharacterized protein n=1 Tax=Catharanthus roseus TaxID=4058 RepID=A0ACC0AYD2_CATRO|nr:hypothetical protein M9H77_15305 [Catharanthus roseus]